MPIVPSFVTPTVERSAVTLSRYCVQVLHYPEWMFWSVQRDGDADYQCQRYWCKWERDMVARHLWEAQKEIEKVATFPIGQRWFADERVPYGCPLRVPRTRVVEAGVEARDTEQADAAVTHNADVGGNPVDSTVTVATTATDPDELHVYYPASLGVEGPVEIDPSDIDISGGTATISIPRWRLVHPNVLDGECGDGGLDYADTTNFLSVVDVERIYNDPSTHATLVWPHACSGTSCSCPSCGDYRQDACVYLTHADIGWVTVLPAAYSAGAWARQNPRCCGEPEYVLLNYRAGIGYDHEDWQQAQDAVVRLAHAKMPEEPCGCSVAQRLWARDRNIPEALTRERLNCPFGLSDGAWAAWEFANALRVVRGGTL